MEILGKLFGSTAKVKMIRLFLFNTQTPYDIKDIVDRAKVALLEAKKEIAVLEKIGLVKKRPFTKDVVKTSGKKTIIQKVKSVGWILDDKFPYLTALRNLLITVSLHKHDDIPKRFVNAGKIKLMVVAGVFIQDWESRVDMLIVGDNLKKTNIDHAVKTLESEIGKELRYSVFETSDFMYRLGIYDKLIRDILDFPHKRVIDKLDVVV